MNVKALNSRMWLVLAIVFMLVLMVGLGSSSVWAANTCEITINTGQYVTDGKTKMDIGSLKVYDGNRNEVTVTQNSENVYSIEVEPGTYTYMAYDRNNSETVGGGRFTVTGDKEILNLKQVYYKEISNVKEVKVTNSAKDYEFPGGSLKYSFYLPVLEGKDHYYYSFIPDKEGYWGSNGELWTYGLTPDQSAAANLSDANYYGVAKTSPVTVKVPKNAEFEIWNRVKFYRPLEAVEPESTNEEGLYKIYKFNVPELNSLHYRLTMEGKVTQAGMLSAKDYLNKDLVIEAADLKNNPKQILAEQALNSRYDANILINVSDSQDLRMNQGEFFDLFCHRNWQAITSISGNYYVDPDFNYSVIQGDSVTVNDKGRITAVKDGTSVVKISYDALDLLDSEGKSYVYSACYPENAGIVVVTVGDNGTTKIEKNINLSAEFDKIYYTRSINGESKETYSEYTFTPTADSDSDIEVRVQKPLQNDWSQGWESYEPAKNGSYTIKLYHGRNIVEVKAGDSVAYHVVNAAGVDISIVNEKTNEPIGEYATVGDAVLISFKGLTMPLPKLGAIYNPGYPKETWVEYKEESAVIKSSLTQYDIATDNTITIIPDKAGTITLTEGKIHSNVIGERLGAHRNINKGGFVTSYTGDDSSVIFNGYRCKLPDISIKVQGENDAKTLAALSFCNINYLDTANPKFTYFNTAIPLATETESTTELARNSTFNPTTLWGATNADDKFRALKIYAIPENPLKVNMLLRYWTEKEGNITVKAYNPGTNYSIPDFLQNNNVGYAELIVSPKNSEDGYPKTYALRISSATGMNSTDTNPYHGTTPYLTGLSLVIDEGNQDRKTIDGNLKVENTTAKDHNGSLIDFGYGFVGTELNYSTTVPGTTGKVRVIPRALVEGNANVILTVNGQTVENGKASQVIDLKEGENLIKIVNTTGSANKTYTLNVIREAIPKAVTFKIPNGGSVLVSDADGKIFSPGEDGSFSLTSGTYTYHASLAGYYTKSEEFTVDSENTVIDIGTMTALPNQNGTVTVNVMSYQYALFDGKTVAISEEASDLTQEKYVDYNNGGYTALHSIIDAFSGSQLSFQCRKGKLTPSVTINPENAGKKAGWICEVNGKIVDPAATLVNNGDVVDYYYNPDYNGMHHAFFDTSKMTITAGSPVTLTLLGHPATESGASSPIKGATINVNGRNSGLVTDEKGQVYLTNLTTPGSYVITATKENSQGQNILTYTLSTVTVEKKQASAGNITVNFRLIGDSTHVDGTEGHSSYVTWIAARDYIFTNSDRVYVNDVFERAVNGAGLTAKGIENNYISSITAPHSLGGYTLSEFSNGKFSGWMYTVNGVHSNFALKEKQVTDGDVIIFHYVDDFTLETSYEGSTPQFPNRWLEAEDIEPAYITASILMYELPDKVTLADKESVAAARKAYDNLTGTEKGYISSDKLAKLTTAEANIKILDDVGEVPDTPDTPDTPVIDVKVMTDVKESNWFYEDVAYVLAKGIMNGTSATTFDSNSNVTRGQFVTILGRWAGIKDAANSAPVDTKFTDVKSGTYYASHIAWASEKGITLGTTETTFEPNAQISRQDMATMIVRYAKVQGVTLSDADGSTFADDAQIRNYAKDAVYSLKASSILQGKGDNMFKPMDNATRAEAARIIRLLMEL